MGKKKKERNRSVPWWRKHGLPAIFGTMLDAMSKDDPDAMAGSVRSFMDAFPNADLFDPTAGGFRVPAEILSEKGIPGLGADFGEACLLLSATECLGHASLLCVLRGRIGGLRLFFDAVARSASAVPATEESRLFAAIAANILYCFAKTRDEAKHPGFEKSCDAAFASGNTEPFWREAQARVLAEREDKELYAESEGGGRELEPSARSDWTL